MVSDPPGTPRPTIATAAILAFVAITAYLPTLATGFTSDDFFILARVKSLGGLSDPGAYFRFGFFDYYRPIAFLTHAADWHLWGLNAFGFHLTNVLLHAASTVLVFQIGRRLQLDILAAGVAASLFALHPASHEGVYWIAARFDLLATCFTLAAILCLADDRPSWRAIGVAAFALGLFSKESAISLILIAPAWDVFVDRRKLRAVVLRLLPLVAIVAAYAVVRSLGADLDATGGARRLPKLIMAAAMLGAILLAAWSRERGPSSTAAPRLQRWWLALVVALAAGAALWGPPDVAAATAKGLGFIAYASFYLVSPVVFPSPPDAWFNPIVATDALPGLAVLCGILGAGALFGRIVVRHAAAIFLCAFIAGTLLPVSSLTGGLRYLYLATAGVSLLVGWLFQRVPRRGRIAAGAAVAIVAAVSATQLLYAGRAWRAGSAMTHEGVALMAASARPCGTKDVLLLTAPAGIGGVYANINYESFDVLEGCSPRRFFTMLRVVGQDVHADLTTAGNGDLELRIRNYAGNIVASEDLSAFTVPVSPGLTQSLETAAGRVHTFPEGATQVFRMTLNPLAQAAARFYYSDGAIRR